MAKNNPDWEKICGQMQALNVSSISNQFDPDNIDCNVTFTMVDNISQIHELEVLEQPMNNKI